MHDDLPRVLKLFHSAQYCKSQGAMVASEDLKRYHDLTYLSALAMQAVVVWDDLTDKCEDDPAVLASLRVTAQELQQVSDLMRRVMDRCHDRKHDLERQLLADLPADPAPEYDVDRMWNDAEAANPGPREFESNLLPNTEQAETPGS